MTFAHPSLLLVALASVPVLAAAFVWSWRVRKRLVSRFVPKRLQETLTVGISSRRAGVRAGFLVAGVFFVLLALARPRLGAGTVEVSQRGLDILVAIDTSRSMLAEDAGPEITRLQRARLAALDLARLAKTDRIGLVAFAGSAFLQCPLTIDFEAFRQSVDALDTSVIQQGGTSIGPAIHAAIEAFSEERSNVRVLILFTDGEEHEAGALDAAKRAESKGLRIYTVGVGTPGGEVIKLRDANGTLSYLKDSRGNAVKSALNESLLRDVAAATGGLYLPLQGPRAMSELYTRALEPLPKADLDARLIEQYVERFQVPLALALAFLLLEALFPECARVGSRLRPTRLAHPGFAPPAPATAAPGAANAVLAVLLAFLFVPAPGAAASSRSALDAYRKADYPAAQEEFERLAKNKPTDPRLRFNAGAAAYRAGDLPSAARHFQDALASTDLRLQSDSFYNLGNTQFQIGESTQETTERQKAWEQSVRAFEAALQLAPAHTNAQHNLDFVRRRLEDLKQQQQQQQKQPKSDPSSKDEQKDDSENSESSDQDRKNEDKDPKKESQKEDGNDPDQEPQPNSDEKPPQDEQNPENPAPDQDSDASSRPDEQQDSKPKDAPDGTEAKSGQTADASDEAPAGEMSPQQALRLLDSAKGEEKLMPLEKKKARPRTIKDW